MAVLRGGLLAVWGCREQLDRLVAQAFTLSGAPLSPEPRRARFR